MISGPSAETRGTIRRPWEAPAPGGETAGPPARVSCPPASPGLTTSTAGVFFDQQQVRVRDDDGMPALEALAALFFALGQVDDALGRQGGGKADDSKDHQHFFHGWLFSIIGRRLPLVKPRFIRDVPYPRPVSRRAHARDEPNAAEHGRPPFPSRGAGPYQMIL